MAREDAAPAVEVAARHALDAEARLHLELSLEVNPFDAETNMRLVESHLLDAEILLARDSAAQHAVERARQAMTRWVTATDGQASTAPIKERIKEVARRASGR